MRRAALLLLVAPLLGAYCGRLQPSVVPVGSDGKPVMLRDPAETPAPPEPVATTVTPGVVAAAHPLAADAGASMLRRGGSAFDAAIATALVLGVVNPQSSGIGGGGFAVWVDGGAPRSLDFRETAPSFFAEDTFATGRDSAKGAWSVGVPGEIAGLAELHRLGGRLPWADVVEPARALAKDGFPVGESLASALRSEAVSVLADPGLSSVFARDGRVLQAGETCRREALARTLEYVALHGAAGFYEGSIALSIAGFLRAQGAPWTDAELLAYRVRELPPLLGSYRGHTIVSMGPPSSGGAALIGTLALLERGRPADAPFGTVAWARPLIRALSHTFADRAAYGADPAFVSVPLDRMLAPSLLDALGKDLSKPGPVPKFEAGLAGREGASKALFDDSGTSHLSVIAGDGTAIALTSTVNLLFGAALLDPGTGVVLNDEMDDFATRPGTPNAFGLVQSRANAPQPGKRPLSSMTPTLVLSQDGKPILAVGAAGGPRIITATLQTVLGVVDRGLSAEEAVAAPRLHHQWLPETVFWEAGFPDETRAALGNEGFVLGEKPSSLAVAQAAARDENTGLFSGGADPRAHGGVALSP